MPTSWPISLRGFLAHESDTQPVARKAAALMIVSQSTQSSGGDQRGPSGFGSEAGIFRERAAT